MATQVCISIGINRYQYLPPLQYGMADAVAMERFFIDAAGWGPEQCLLMTDTSPQHEYKSTYPDRENINRWLKTWSWEKLHHGDLVWFFFSGCGASVGNEDYLLPIDAKPENVASTGISIRQLYQQFHDIGVTALVFLDTNRPQLSSDSGIGRATAKLAHEYQIPTFLSCQSHEVSHEDAGLGHGLFTTALLEALNYHPDLNLETIDEYLTTRLAELSEHHWKPLQTPVGILPSEVSPHRPVFSATTQSSISATIPEIVYAPPTPAAAAAPNPRRQEDSYAPYEPPTISIAIPAEKVGSGAIVKHQPIKAPRQEQPNWAKASFLVSLMVAAGVGIYLLRPQSQSQNEPAIVNSASENNDNNSAATAALAQAKQFVRPGDATSRYQAILAARKIPATTPVIEKEVKDSIELWSAEIYQIAKSYADKQMWQIAIDTARMVPKDAASYDTAQAAMQEWKGKF